MTISLSPTTLSQDGSSTSQVRISTNGPNGPESQNVRLEMFVGGQLTDLGTLSARTVTTGSNGLATAVFTAPPPPPPPANLSVNTVSIRASLTGSDALASTAMTADIRLVPLGVILPLDTPTPQFTISPPPTTLNVSSTFDASTSCPGAADANNNCLITSTSSQTITNFAWNFGDGGTANGQMATHAFATPGTFNVVLTVTNDRGVKASKTQSVTIGAASAPSGDWVFSPANPAIGDSIVFNADGIKPAPGRTLVQFSWNFGDGSTASGFVTSHTFAAAGTFNVVLSVADDTGQKTVISHPVNVGTGAPTATFSASPAGGHSMTFDASASRGVGSATISTYQWSFGDGGFAGPSSSPTVTHLFPATGTFTVTVTVTDNLGRSGVFSTSVSVP